ncbi:MAG TPA: bifunctional DNA-formamidopyrimidine glycosylase/DNA-(apurinic or apyrimidinic site) lyase [Terracidiphilus sp.]|jgi:formamidopyrimidine-DNA glycosylase|nr:bifunctional DNA-formamidopyrimidine glycosylase/DNA-(apurinic or apyrimidinic site) lyase [Terracidiphilus sp.]
MPELPEVETIARGVNARVRGDRIVHAWFAAHNRLFKTPAAMQVKGLEGRVLLAVHRTGKHIVCELSKTPKGNLNGAADLQPDAQWIVHLGMTGRLLVTTPDAAVAAHTHARVQLESGKELRFVDPRRFGKLDFRDLGSGDAFNAAGSEPLLIAQDEFAALFRGRKLAIKAALLNQSLLSGVGNIYADESLFHAGIRPRREAGRLSRAELERLRVALKTVLEHAIQLGGSSVSDYVDAEGMRGFFQLEHCVYLRTGQPCRRCNTPIRRVIIAGRGTHFCPKCQR